MKLLGELQIWRGKLFDEINNKKRKYLVFLILLIVGFCVWAIIEDPFNPYFKVKTLRNMPNGTPVYIGDYKLFYAGDYRKESDLNKGDDKITCASIYDIKKQKNIPLNSCMSVPRSSYLPILLPNDKVLILGGYNSGKTKELRLSDHRNAEIYDLKTNEFRRIEDTRFEYSNISQYVTLQNGRVFLVSGEIAGFFDIKAEKIVNVENLPLKVTKVILLDNKKILLSGLKKTKAYTEEKPIVYNPISHKFEKTTNPPKYFLHRTSTKLQDGNIVFCGGWIEYKVGCKLCSTYDYKTNSFRDIGNLNRDRAGLYLISTNDKVFALGGQKGGPEFAHQIRSVELYDPKTNRWKIIARPITTFDGRPVKINEKTYLLNEKLLIFK